MVRCDHLDICQTCGKLRNLAANSDGECLDASSTVGFDLTEILLEYIGIVSTS